MTCTSGRNELDVVPVAPVADIAVLVVVELVQDDVDHLAVGALARIAWIARSVAAEPLQGSRFPSIRSAPVACQA
jgi:hypothetical protein